MLNTAKSLHGVACDWQNTDNKSVDKMNHDFVYAPKEI